MNAQPEVQQITDFVETKLTSAQKRGDVRVQDRGQIDVGNREILSITRPRSNAELADAQLNLAGLAAEHPDLKTDEEREAWLRDVLEYLGLEKPIARKQKKLLPLACWPYTGTERGYNVHLRTYTDPCVVCQQKHDFLMSEKFKAMGIDHEGVIA